MIKYALISLCVVHFAVQAVELNIPQAISDAESQHLAIPEEHVYKIPTLNHYGYMFTKFDPIIERFLQSIEKNPAQACFEVGGAYGNVAEAALEKGAENYYLNDCEVRHLKAFAKKLKENGKMHLCHGLHLIYGKCPDDIIPEENSLDAILVNKVLHFFAPDTIDGFVQWMNKALKQGGRAFILTVSPFFKRHEELLEDYKKKKEEGSRFPGYCSLYKDSNPAQEIEAQARPTSLLFMELDTLKSLFQQHGFKIEEEFELAMVDSDTPEWKPGKDMVAIIAQKL